VRWLEREEILKELISPRFQLPRRPEKAPHILEPGQVQLLLLHCQETHRARPWASEALEARNRAILAVLIDTGLRRFELAGLRLGDVDYGGLLLSVIRKGGKEQQVPISTDAMSVLDEYLSIHRQVLVGKESVVRRSDPVFVNGLGRPLGLSGISRFFARLQKNTGIDVAAHDCRRFMATFQLGWGRDSWHVQRQLGHKSPSSMKAYVLLSTEHIQASHERYSPMRATLSARPARKNRRYWELDE